jgi:hypothetical protein
LGWSTVEGAVPVDVAVVVVAVPVVGVDDGVGVDVDVDGVDLAVVLPVTLATHPPQKAGAMVPGPGRSPSCLELKTRPERRRKPWRWQSWP